MLACQIIIAFVVLVNVIGFFLARRDKRAAVSTRRARKPERTPERLFYLAAFLGGWPGTALAFKRYRHKTRKVRFLVRFGLFSLVGTVALVGWWIGLGCSALFG